MKKIILPTDPEAAQYVKNIEGWVSANNHFYGKSADAERMARNDGSTHKKCACGNVYNKEWAYTCCPDCIDKKSHDKFLALPYQVWDKTSYVVDRSGHFFWSIDELEDFMYENEIESIDLYICSPIHYRHIDTEDVASDAHDDWDPPTELEQKIKEFNSFIDTLSPHSWTAGKIRTSHKIDLNEE